MELRDLTYVVTVAEELHFGRAAERLHIAQSAVSQSVRRLERELGVELFDRTSRRVALTPAGLRFVPAAREVLDASVRARASVAEYATGGTLRLGTSNGLGSHLDGLLAALPRSVGVELVAASGQERVEQVVEGRLDGAFVRGPREHPALRRIVLWDDPLQIALSARHPLASRPEIRLADLAAYPLRLVERRLNAPLVDLVIGACHAAGFEPLPGGTSGALADTLALIGADSSWTVVYAAHARLLAPPRVVFQELAAPGLAMPTALLVRRDTSSPILPLLLAALGADQASPASITSSDR